MIKIPCGVIIFEDYFKIEDLFHFKNFLSIETPFQCASKISSECSLDTDMQTTLFDFNLNLKNYSTWLKVIK